MRYDAYWHQKCEGLAKWEGKWDYFVKSERSKSFFFLLFWKKKERNGGDLTIGVLDMGMKGEAAHDVGVPVLARMVVVAVKSWPKLTSDLTMVDHSACLFVCIGFNKALDHKLGWCSVMSTVRNSSLWGRLVAVEIYSHVKMMTLSRQWWISWQNRSNSFYEN